MSEQKERGGAGWDEVPAWMQKLRAKAVTRARELAKEQMKRRKARFEEIPEETWEEAEMGNRDRDRDREEEGAELEDG